ncbi:MAG: class I SAM-dependent methyltransferase [Actinomycetota bacterium]|nr:class I SAM-dependent methyltransferase [Actinomycetota bacterium]
MSKLTGERPVEGVTPDSLLALHEAGYRAVSARLGPGWVLDIGCGDGFESASFLAPDRSVLGIDYSVSVAQDASRRWSEKGLRVAGMDALRLGIRDASMDWVCSSHVVEHFERPEDHVREVGRILADSGTAFFLTPNRPFDFENPFHLVQFERDDLSALLGDHFANVHVFGMGATPRVHEDFAARRAKAEKLLRLDFLDLRHRMPRSWYIGFYTRVLPVAYRLLAKSDTSGATGITADDFFISDDTSDAALVLLGVVSSPFRGS